MISIWTVLFWTITTYLIASIPFSLLIGKIFLGVDIRTFGDGNPGASNVKRAGGSTTLTALAILMDGLKGLLPVGTLYWLSHWYGYEIVPVALAAILGHSYSIFLGFKGGKSVAITNGVWVGLMMIEALLLMPTVLTIWFFAIKQSAWAVMFMMFSLLAYLLLTNTDYPLLLIWLGNTIIIVIKHRDGLTDWPRLRRKGASD